MSNHCNTEERKKLGFLDKFLTLWIFGAMIVGIAIGYFFPSFSHIIQSFSTNHTTNIPIAIGLILMMYPPLVKVNFNKISTIFSNKKLLFTSLFITWIIGPFLMFSLALFFLKSYPEYLTGLIIIGIAPCIAMVIVWNELAKGNREYVAGLVGINSILQVLFFSFYAYFYLQVILPYFGGKAVAVTITISQIAKTVGIYLGIPFLMAVVSRIFILKTKGELWLNKVYIPKISPITLFSLLFTIIVMFSLKGQLIVEIPKDVLTISIPLIFYFIIMFLTTFMIVKWLGGPYDENVAISFTASGNNFELAIAVSIGVFGINSGQAFAGVIGPLVEVPILIFLVNVAFWLKKKLY